VEGLADGPTPHALQDAFDLTGAAQCGFCTPGMLCSASQLLADSSAPRRDEIASALAGNLCRCTGYTKIFEAVELAAAAMASGRTPADALAADRIRSSRPPPVG
jgi:carbon-monoxide dehydrogenase small subunit